MKPPEPDIVPYDLYWSMLYRKEKSRLLSQLAAWVLAIEHIGSTAVEGISARPVIDLLVGVRRLADVDTFCLPLLRTLGYRYVGDPQNEESEERLFIRGTPLGRASHQLYFVEKGGASWWRYLGVRDTLRRDRELATGFIELKTRYQQQGADLAAYTAAKEEFFNSIQSVPTLAV